MARKNLYPPSITPGIPKLGDKPHGWIETTFGDVLRVVKRKADLQDDFEYQLVNAKRSRGGIVPRAKSLGKDILTKTQFFTKEGDFLISRRQIIHGACGIVPQELDGSIVSNEYSTLRTNTGLLMKFLGYYCYTVYFQQTCFQSSVGVDVEKMIFNLGDWLKMPVYLPSVKEQQRIVEILSTWDEAIRLTQELIAAKQQRKKGLMQRLLTGQVRFKEFGERPWRPVSLANIAEIILSNVDKKTEESETPVRLCNYMDVFNNHHIANNMKFMEATATTREIDRFTLQKNDVIITKDSETREEIAESTVVIDDLDNVLCGYHLAILRPDPTQVFGPFLKEMLLVPSVRHQFISKANGITRFGLTQDTIHGINLQLPSTEEQRRISAVLQACDHEIQLLQKKLAALQQQKKGLMQRLLTGQVRVPPVQPVAFVPVAPSSMLTSTQVFIIWLIAQYQPRKHAHPSRTEAQKLAYFAQEAAGLPMNLHFYSHDYGPFSKELYQHLADMEGALIIGFQGGEPQERKEIEATTEAIVMAENYLRQYPAEQEKLTFVLKLVQGFETPRQMELLATVHWIMKKNPNAPFVEIVRYVHEWNKHKQSFGEDQIRQAWEHLCQFELVP